jgi:hypothetical protein
VSISRSRRARARAFAAFAALVIEMEGVMRLYLRRLRLLSLVIEVGKARLAALEVLRLSILVSIALSTVVAASFAAAGTAEDRVPVKQGELVSIDMSGKTKVVIDECSKPGQHIGPTYSTFAISPPSAAGLVSAKPSVDNIKKGAGRAQIRVSLTAPIGLVFTAAWTAVADGCYSAHGSVSFAVVRPSFWSQEAKYSMRQAYDRMVKNAEGTKAAGTVACIVKTGMKEGAKAAYKAAAEDLGKSLIPVDIPPTDPCSFLFVTAEGAMYMPALVMNAIANDPPDPNFDELIEAKTKARFAVRARTKESRPVADAMNAEAANAAKIHGFLAALLTSVERAQGADAAGKRMWVDRQMRAARGFAAQAATALSEEPHLRSRLAIALKGAGFPSFTLDAGTAAAVQKQFASEGLSSEERRVLRALGASESDMRSLDARLDKTETSELVGLRFPELLTDSNALAALRGAAKNLRAFARA